MAAQVISRRALADISGSAARAIAFATYARAERRPLPPPAPLPPPPLGTLVAGAPAAEVSIDAAGPQAVAAFASGEPTQQVCCSASLLTGHGMLIRSCNGKCCGSLGYDTPLAGSSPCSDHHHGGRALQSRAWDRSGWLAVGRGSR